MLYIVFLLEEKSGQLRKADIINATPFLLHPKVYGVPSSDAWIFALLPLTQNLWVPFQKL